MFFKARSRTKLARRKTIIKHVVAYFSTVFVLTVMLYGAIRYFAGTVNAAAPGYDPKIIEKEVQVIKEVEVDRTFKTQKQQILAYIVEKFGDRSDDAITMISKCENRGFSPTRKSGLNIQKSGRRSYDIGVMQINVDESNIVEQEKLTDWKYNIDRGYEKYHAAGDTFRPWVCAHEIWEKNYLDK